MSYLLDYNLSYMAIKIIKELGKYRGMNAVQLTAMLYGPDRYTLPEEKSTYNYLGDLKKKGLVSSRKLEGTVYRGSIYFLTPKGYELFKYFTNVEIGHYGHGWIESYEEFGDQAFGDLPYDLYRPPLRQPAHHLLLIDFFIQMNNIDGGSVIDHRLNLYAAHTYYVDQQKYRFRPDAEIWFRDSNRFFTIEIDRGTEDGEQLEKKFETYRRYFEYLKAQGKTDEIPHGIIFVCESKSRLNGMKRRWATILNSFWKELFDYRDSVNLIYTTIDRVQQTLMFEMDRSSLEQKARNTVVPVLKDSGCTKATSYHDTATKQAVFAHAIKDNQYHVFFTVISNEFESFIYARFIDFYTKRLHAAKDAEVVKDLFYKGMGSIIFYQSSKPVILDKFDTFSITDNTKKFLHSFATKSTVFIPL